MPWPHDSAETIRNHLSLTFMAAIFIAAVLPMFFDVYRTVFYQTMSYDDYARYLLWLLGQPGGAIPPSPHVYRLGSVILAAPFYYLPVVVFTGEGINHAPAIMSPEYIRASQAMCAANMAYASISAVLAGLYLVLRRDVSLEWAFIATLVFLLLTRYLGMGAADGVATLPLLITVIAMIERRFTIFALSVTLGTIVNEKVAMVALLTVGLRAIFVAEDRRIYLSMAATAAIPLCVYSATVLTLNLPGLENQRNPTTYLSSLISMTRTLTNAKGMYQNVWPAIIAIILWRISVKQTSRPTVYLCDVGIIIMMFIFALALNVQYNAGRIVMFSVPLFVLGAVERLSRLSRASKSHAAVIIASAPPMPPTDLPPVVAAEARNRPQGICLE